jgi:predicted MFS family arabinose efflux permease
VLEAPTRPSRSPLTSWLAVVSVMTGIFAIVTTEILPIGLLTPIASTFGISAGTAGLTMTLPGLLAAVAAPSLTVVTARLDRRFMLCALMLLLAVADFLAAAAPAYWVMMLSRALVGLTIGGFWSIGAGLAVRLVRREQAGTATAVIFSAVPLGSVLGVPAGTLIGHLAGWRMAFVVMGLLSLGVFVALLVLLPSLPAGQPTRLSVLRGLLSDGGIRLALLATVLIVLAHFGAYTYVTPFLLQVTQVSAGSVTTYLLVYGVAGIAGNFLAGAALSRHPRATSMTAAALLATATALLPVAGGATAGALTLLVIWGLAYGAVPVCSQTWFARSAPHAPEAASILFTSSFQATLSLGALAGGVVVDHISVVAVMGIAGALAALTASVLWFSLRRRPPSARPPAP